MLAQTELHPYRKPFLLALALHVVLLICLLSNFNLFSKQPAAAKNPANNAIKAVAVNPNELQKQVDALKAAEQAKLNAEKQQQEELKQQEEKKAADAQKKIDDQKKTEENKLAETAKLEAQKKITQEKEKKEKLEQTIQKQMEQKKKKLADKKTKQEKEKTLQEQLDAEAATEPTAETPTDVSAEASAKAEASAAAASAQAGEIDKYKSLIIGAIGQQWIVPDNVNKELSAKLLIRLAPGGMVLDVKLVKSSGDPALDRSAIAAVYKASPLPVPTEPELFDKMREISLTVQPEDK